MQVRFREYISSRGEKSAVANRPMTHAEISLNERLNDKGGLISNRGYLIFHDFFGTRRVSFDGFQLIPRPGDGDKAFDLAIMESALPTKGTATFTGQWFGSSLVFSNGKGCDVDLCTQTASDYPLLEQLCPLDQKRELRASWSGGVMKFEPAGAPKPAGKKSELAKLSDTEIRDLAVEKGVEIPANASRGTINELVAKAIGGSADGT